jgi:hypothetical protein
MGTWPGYSVYVWLLTLLPLSCFLILMNDDANKRLEFYIDIVDDNEKFDAAYIKENERKRAFGLRKALAYVYLGCVFASFMFGIFGSWGMG